MPWRRNLPCKNPFTELSFTDSQFTEFPSFYGIQREASCVARQPKWISDARSARPFLSLKDEGFVRDVPCEILRDAGYRVVQADCAEAARKVFQRCGKRIRLLLSDAVLPDSSGVVLAQTLCRLSAGLKVILASGYPRRALRGLDHKTGQCSWPSLMVQFL